MRFIFLDGTAYPTVTTAKYLGITISKDMNRDTHIDNITSKANKIIGFLRRNLPIQNTETKTLAYKSMVRSNLEYVKVWIHCNKVVGDFLKHCNSV
jgi:hypothetical protein